MTMRINAVCALCGVDGWRFAALHDRAWVCNRCFRRWVHGSEFPYIQWQKEPDHGA